MCIEHNYIYIYILNQQDLFHLMSTDVCNVNEKTWSVLLLACYTIDEIILGSASISQHHVNVEACKPEKKKHGGKMEKHHDGL